MFSVVRYKDGKYKTHENTKEINVSVGKDIVFSAESENGILNDIKISKNSLKRESVSSGADIYLNGDLPVFRMHQWHSPEHRHIGVMPCSDDVQITIDAPSAE